MEAGSNWKSMLVSGIGVGTQFAGLMFYLVQLDPGFTPRGALRNALIIAGIGTAILAAGLAMHAKGKWQDPRWGFMALLGFIGAAVVATRKDLHKRAQREAMVVNAIADLPGEHSVSFFCIGCNYQLNGITSNACPECGRPFDPDDIATVILAGQGLNEAPWTGRWSLICGIGGVLCSTGVMCGAVLSIVGIAMGHTALAYIKRNHSPGFGVALAGLILSYFALALSIAALLFMFLA